MATEIDNLRSEDSMEILLALGEGPMQGLANGLYNFYIGDTPVVNLDGTKNFEDLEINVFPGYHAADPRLKPVVFKLGGSSSNFNVGTQLAKNVPVTRQVELNQIDAIDVRLNIGSLFKSDGSGPRGSELKILMQIKKSSTPSWDNAEVSFTFNIKGKTTSTYIKERRFEVYPLTGSQFWQIRLTKLSDDSDGDKIGSVVAWDSYQAIVKNNSKTYPGTTLVQLYARATNQFSSIPQISMNFKGKLIRTPSNYDPASRTYTGVWDGTFASSVPGQSLDYTDNPAWILYDFVTNNTYGLSAAGTPISMDKYSVYEAAQWCDEMVSNGAGGFQPRFTFNGIINSPRSAIDQARYIAGVFGATVFDDGNTSIILKVDRPTAPTHLFTFENVTGEGFQYSMTDMTTWFNEITVSFVNPSLKWTEDRRVVKSEEAIAKYGRIPLDFVAVGCINEAEAVRRAMYKLNTSLTEKMMVSFNTNRLASVVEPFDVILISDPTLGYGLSGRIKSLNDARTVITLRDPLYLETGVTYDMTFRTVGGIITRTFNAGIAGNNSTITLNSALPADIPDRATFAITKAGSDAGVAKPFRVLKVEQTNSADEFTITAIEINPNKFSDAEEGVISSETEVTTNKDPSNILPPTNVTFSDFYDKSANAVWTVIEVTLPRAEYAFYSEEFEVWSRPVVDGVPQGQFEKQTVFYGNTLVNHLAGPNEFKILPKNLFGQVAPLPMMPTWTHTVGTKEVVGDPPEPVENITVRETETGVVLEWDPPSGEEDYVHHYIVKEGETYATATTISNTVTQTQLGVELTKRLNKFWIAAVSISFVEGEPASIDYNNAAPAPPTNIKANVAYENVLITFDRNTEIDIVGYHIQNRKVGDNIWVDMQPDGVFDQGIPNTAYEFRVAAKDKLSLLFNDEVWSIPVSAKTRDTLEVQRGFDDVQSVTAVNLVRNGSFEKGNLNWQFSPGTVLTAADAPYADPLNGTSKVLKLGDGTAAIATAITDKFIVLPKRNFTASFSLLKDAIDPGESHYVTMRVYDSGNNMLEEFAVLGGKLFIEPQELSATEWQRFFTTFTIPDGGIRAELVVAAQGAGILYVDGVQVQRGDVPTGFNPHVAEQLSAADLGDIITIDNTAPGIVTGFSVTGSFKNIILTWTPPADSDLSYYEIWRSATNNRDTALKVAQSGSTVYADPVPVVGQQYYYWVRAVDLSGNVGPFNSLPLEGTPGKTIPITAADIQNLSIVNALIADATIDNAKISSVSASKLTAGTITAGSIYVGDNRFELSGTNRLLTIKDMNDVTRVKLGRLGSLSYNYGIEVYNQTGTLILGADGLGINTVGSLQLTPNSVTTGAIVANAINADKIAANAITASHLSASSVSATAIAAGAVTADKITVANLSSINSNMGVITAGTMQAAGSLADKNFWNLNTGEFRIGTPDNQFFMHMKPSTGQLLIQGAITATAGDYNSLSNRPESLSDINLDEGTKLGGIQEGADVTSQNTALNVMNVGAYDAIQLAQWANDPASKINITSTTINGGRITTGSITASQLNVANLGAITAKLGVVEVGRIMSADKQSWLNFMGDEWTDAESNGQPKKILRTDGFSILADGSFLAEKGKITGDLIVEGTISGDKLANGSVSEFSIGNGRINFFAYAESVYLVIMDNARGISSGYIGLYDVIGTTAYCIWAGGIAAPATLGGLSIGVGVGTHIQQFAQRQTYLRVAAFSSYSAIPLQAPPSALPNPPDVQICVLRLKK